MQIRAPAFYGAVDTFDLDTRLALSSAWLVGNKNGLADLAVQLDTCFIVHGSGIDTALSVLAWLMMWKKD